MAITTQQIHAIADQLQEQGTKPTLSKVRNALGGGSFTTISDAMRSWRQDHQEEQELQQVDLPSGITERLQSLGADVWQTAINMANDRLSKEREVLEVVKVKAQSETDEAQEAVKTLEQEQADLLQQLDEVTATAETADKIALEATTDRDIFKQNLADTQHQLELERIKADTAQTQLTEARTALDKASDGLVVSSSKVATLEATASSDKAQIERLTAELTATKVELKTVTTERNEVATTTAEVKGELRAITAERDKLSALNEQLNQTHTALTTEHQVLSRQYDELTQEKDSLKNDYNVLLQQYDKLAANYQLEQEKVSALTIKAEKMQSGINKDSN